MSTSRSLASMSHLVGEFGFPAIRADAGVDAGALRALDDAVYLPTAAMILVFVVGFTVGLVVLMVGLRRAGVVPVWAVVAAVIAVVCGASGGVVAGVVGVLAWLAALVPVAGALPRTAPRPVADRPAAGQLPAAPPA